MFSNDDGNWVPRDVPCRLRARRLKDFSPEEQDEIRRSIADGIPRKLAMIQVDTDRLREKQRTRRELIESAKVLLRRRHK